MVFAGLYPTANDDYPLLRDALEKLELNDASLLYEPESSVALGLRLPLRLPRHAPHGDHAGAPGARVRPRPADHRAERGVPRLHDTTATIADVDNPADLPAAEHVQRVEEPWVDLEHHRAEPLHRHDHGAGARPGAASSARWTTSTSSACCSTYEMPLAELIVDFYDQLKSRTQGYASLDYQFADYRPSDLVKLDILVNGSRSTPSR